MRPIEGGGPPIQPTHSDQNDNHPNTEERERKNKERDREIQSINSLPNHEMLH